MQGAPVYAFSYAGRGQILLPVSAEALAKAGLSKNPGQKDTTMLLDCSPARMHDSHPPYGRLLVVSRYRTDL